MPNERESWERFAAAALSAVAPKYAIAYANEMLEASQRRFGQPDSSKMEPTVKENLTVEKPLQRILGSPMKFAGVKTDYGAKNAQVEKPTSEEIYRKALEDMSEIYCKHPQDFRDYSRLAIEEAEKL